MSASGMAAVGADVVTVGASRFTVSTVGSPGGARTGGGAGGAEQAHNTAIGI